MLDTLQMNMEIYRRTSYGVLLNVIAYHAGREKNTGCYASYATLAEEIGKTRAAVRKGVAKLLEEGWIFLDGRQNRCCKIRLTVKTIALLMGKACARKPQTETSQKSYEAGHVQNDDCTPHGYSSNHEHSYSSNHEHGYSSNHVDGYHSNHITSSELDNEKTKELNSVCVHSNQQETVQPSSQKNEHTHTDSSSSFSGETVKKPAKRKARAKKDALPPLPLPKDVDEVIAYAERIEASKAQAVAFCKYYDSVGWIVKGEVMYNWQSRLDLWVETDRRRAAEKAQAQQNQTASGTTQKTRMLAPHEQKYYQPDARKVPCSVVWNL